MGWAVCIQFGHIGATLLSRQHSKPLGLDAKGLLSIKEVLVLTEQTLMVQPHI